jgi:hypothetical protein
MPHHHDHHHSDDDWCSVISQVIFELFSRSIDRYCKEDDRVTTQAEQGTRPRRRIDEAPSETDRLTVT